MSGTKNKLIYSQVHCESEKSKYVRCLNIQGNYNAAIQKITHNLIYDFGIVGCVRPDMIWICISFVICHCNHVLFLSFSLYHNPSLIFVACFRFFCEIIDFCRYIHNFHKRNEESDETYNTKNIQRTPTAMIDFKLKYQTQFFF